MNQVLKKLKKIAIITTHPIQYNAPFFKLLAEQEGISVKVFYTWGKSVLEKKFDPGFRKEIKWDIPLLEGYDYEFLENISFKPGSHHHSGINNPGIIDSIEAYAPAVLLIFGWNFKSHLKCLRYFKNKIPVFFRGDSTLLDDKIGLKSIVRSIYLRWVYRHIDYALYTGQHNKQYFLKNGLKPGQLIHAPHAVDVERFMEPDGVHNAKAKEWKEKLGIAQDEITILFAGKLEPVKNPLYLLQLAEKLKDFPVKIIIAGNGQLENEMKEKAAGNRQIIFLDFQNQSVMPVVYRLGDIFIMCSKSETWGLGANEAMACGAVLALSSKVGGAIDLVNDSNGIVFSLNETDECAAFIRQFITDKNKLANMKAASKEKCTGFTFQKIITPFINKVNEY